MICFIVTLHRYVLAGQDRRILSGQSGPRRTGGFEGVAFPPSWRQGWGREFFASQKISVPRRALIIIRDFLSRMDIVLMTCFLRYFLFLFYFCLLYFYSYSIIQTENFRKLNLLKDSEIILVNTLFESSVN